MIDDVVMNFLEKKINRFVQTLPIYFCGVGNLYVMWWRRDSTLRARR